MTKRNKPIECLCRDCRAAKLIQSLPNWKEMVKSGKLRRFIDFMVVYLHQKDRRRIKRKHRKSKR